MLLLFACLDTVSVSQLLFCSYLVVGVLKYITPTRVTVALYNWAKEAVFRRGFRNLRTQYLASILIYSVNDVRMMRMDGKQLNCVNILKALF